jgi:hypothetical protein
MAAHCKSCGSQNIRKFKGELAVLLPGSENLAQPTVLVWSELLVCLACGAGQFVVPERELLILAERSAAA